DDHATQVYTLLTVQLFAFLNLLPVEVDILVYNLENASQTFDDLPSRFGYRLPAEDLKGFLINSKPESACDPIHLPLKENSSGAFIVLIDCNFDIKVLNAQRAGYKAAIVHNVDSDDLISMGSNNIDGLKKIDIPSVFFKAGVVPRLQKHQEKMVSQSIIFSQAAFKGFLSYQEFKNLKVLCSVGLWMLILQIWDEQEVPPISLEKKKKKKLMFLVQGPPKQCDDAFCVEKNLLTSSPSLADSLPGCPVHPEEHDHVPGSQGMAMVAALWFPSATAECHHWDDHATQVYTLLTVQLFAFLNLLPVEVDILVYNLENASQTFDDLPSRFGYRLPAEDLKGFLINSKPESACDPIHLPLKENSSGAFIVLIDCNFDIKVLNAQRAGYKAAIVHNVDSDDLISMGSNNIDGLKKIDIPSVFIGESPGNSLKDEFTYKKGGHIILVPEFSLPPEYYLIPFFIIVDICLILMAFS
ncbi:Hypothetical predicted protein, partial [Marmota monax]